MLGRALAWPPVGRVTIRLHICHKRPRFTGSNSKWSSQTGISPSAIPYVRNATLLATATMRNCRMSFMQKAVITRPDARKPTASQVFIGSRDSAGRLHGINKAANEAEPRLGLEPAPMQLL